MANLATAISKSLLSKLPAEASTKFNVDEAEFKEFLQEFLSAQLKTGKGGRSKGTKGTNGKGRLTGFILFSQENRASVKEENPNNTFGEVGKELGSRWRALSKEEQDVFTSRANRENEKNGLATPAPNKSKSTSLTSSKTDTNKMSVVRHAESKAWVIDGTTFVVAGQKSQSVVGKLKGTKVVALTPSDKKKCASNGWSVGEVQKKKKKHTNASEDDDSE